MNTFHYIPNVKVSRIGFDNIVVEATKYIKSLSETQQKSLKEDLENGLANLTSSDQLQMYLSSYGDIHRQKLLMAYEKIPNKIWNEDKFAVIDYGCGQCIAEMSGVPLATVARFEQKGLIAFESLIKLAMSLGYTSEIKNLFSTPKFDTMEELDLIRKEKS